MGRSCKSLHSLWNDQQAYTMFKVLVSFREMLPVSEVKESKVSLEMRDYLADFIVEVYKEADLRQLYPWQVSICIEKSMQATAFLA